MSTAEKTTEQRSATARSSVIWSVLLAVALVGFGFLTIDRLNDPETSGTRLEPGAIRAVADLPPGGTLSWIQPIDNDDATDLFGGTTTLVGVLAQTSPNLEYLGSNVVYRKDTGPIPSELRKGFTPAAKSSKTSVYLPAGADLTTGRADTRFVVPKGSRAYVVSGFRLGSGEYGGIIGVFLDFKEGEYGGREALNHAALVCAAGFDCPNPDGDRDDALVLFKKLGLLDLPLPSYRAPAIAELPIVR